MLYSDNLKIDFDSKHSDLAKLLGQNDYLEDIKKRSFSICALQKENKIPLLCPNQL